MVQTSTTSTQGGSGAEHPRADGPRGVFRVPLHVQILVGLLLGAAAGYVLGAWGLRAAVDAPAAGTAAAHVTSSGFFMAFDLLGDLFLQGLKLIIVPLVTTSIVMAVVNLGRGAGLGRLGGKTLLYYAATSLCAILVGLVLINAVAPGVGPANTGLLVGEDLSAFASDQSMVAAKTEGKSVSSFLNVFRAMVPANLLSAAADNGQLLGLIVVALAVGYFLARLDTDGGRRLISLVQAVYDITLSITELVLKLAPIGIFGLIAATVAEQYATLAPDDRFGDFATGIGKFALVAVAALGVHFLVTMPLILIFVARVNPLRHYRAMAPALATAFSTASSSSTLPVTMECVQDRAGVSKKTTGFVLPLGATVNMDGTALYECVAAVFICQCFGVELTVAQQFLIVVTALLTSIGVAGVPSASLVAIVVILEAVQNNLPAGSLPDGVLLVSGMGLLLVFDRPLDMCRTAVNVFSDSVGAVVVAKSEGESPLSDAGVPAQG